ncbi:MAG: hypothetical protein NC039_04385 [Muribaculaceae bacterium]|nr:hypothetical protein [Muribaculaceae bacterium]
MYSTISIHCETKNSIRIEGVYYVSGSLRGESIDEEYSEEGIVVYYSHAQKNGETEYQKHLYPCSDSTKRLNPISNSFCPSPILDVNDNYDSLECCGDTLVLNFKYEISDNNNSIKALRTIGLGLEITGCSIQESFLHDVSLKTLKSLSSRVAYTVKGKNFKRIFGNVPVECNDTITVTIRKIECIESNKIKQYQKEDNKRFSAKGRQEGQN